MNNIFSWYLAWQFYDTPKAILAAWRNYLWFNLNYFSLPLLLKTFFSHWRRSAEGYGRSFSPTRYLQVFVVNMFSRVVGMILRTVLIAVSIVLEIFIIIAGAIVFLGWMLASFILLAGIAISINLIF